MRSVAGLVRCCRDDDVVHEMNVEFGGRAI